MRPARAADVPAVAALVRRAYAAYVPLLGRRPAPMDADHAAQVAAGYVHLLERDGALVALAVLEDRGDHLWIDNLAVDPARHGEGIGQSLLAFAEAEARRLRRPELRLLTNALMERNRAIYARAGFAETELREEGGLRRVYMARRLSA